MDLVRLAREYLGTLGYEIGQRGKDLLVGHRLSVAGERQTILVWIPQREPGYSFTSQEEPYLSRFDAATKEYPRAAEKFMLVETYEGISERFRNQAITKYGVKIRVPIFLFDTLFRYEESREAKAVSSAARDLVSRGEQWSGVRVPQPYVIRHSPEKASGQDILEALLDGIRRHSASPLNLIVGPAGMGKTVLFEVLFSRMYREFQEYKNRQLVFPRPLPLIPEYIRASVAPTLRGLIEGFLRTEIAAPIRAETFQWMLVNGFAAWLIDGLDEVIERDSNFFDDLLDMLTKPGTVDPIVVLCLRDSLLTTNQDLRDFLDEYHGSLTIYELRKWETPSKHAFAKIELGDKGAEPFMTVLRTHRELDSLSSVPYYCKLIIEEYKVGRLLESYSEPELLSHALSNIVEREYGKELLDRELLPPAIVVEVLQELAAEDAMRDFSGFTRDTIREYTNIVLPTGLNDQTADKLVTDMVQLALFREGLATGYVQFAQEILEHYLLGEYLYRNFQTSESAFQDKVSARVIPADSVTLRTIAARLQSDDDIRRLLEYLQRSNISDTAFRNMLQILAFSIRDPTGLKQVSFEGRNISGVKLMGLDLRGVSFRLCNLTDVEFNACQLQNTKFEGAIINRTAFFLREKEDLRGVTFGNMERFFSLWTRLGKLETEVQVARAWLKERTRVVAPIVEPCAAAKQLRYLFSKYIYPDGKAKRAILDRRGVLAGSEFHDRQTTLEAVIRHGYLISEVRYRDRIRRCDGDMYHEMVSFVTELTLPNGLRSLLNEICPVENCLHIPPLPKE